MKKAYTKFELSVTFSSSYEHTCKQCYLGLCRFTLHNILANSVHNTHQVWRRSNCTLIFMGHYVLKFWEASWHFNTETASWVSHACYVYQIWSFQDPLFNSYKVNGTHGQTQTCVNLITLTFAFLNHASIILPWSQTWSATQKVVSWSASWFATRIEQWTIEMDAGLYCWDGCCASQQQQLRHVLQRYIYPFVSYGTLETQALWHLDVFWSVQLKLASTAAFASMRNL